MYVNATNRQVNARLDGGTWIVKVDNKEVYEVPLAAIEGGRMDAEKATVYHSIPKIT